MIKTKSLVSLLERAGEVFMDKTAVEDESGEIGFNTLRHRAKKIGTSLLRDGGGRNVPAAVFIPKSIDALCAMQGVLYSGAPYVPVDCNMPTARLCKLFDNLRPSHVITLPGYEDRLDGVLPEGTRLRLLPELEAGDANEDALARALGEVRGDDPAYIIYTSGSTGTPKGVVIPHSGVLSYAGWVRDTFGFDRNSVMASQAPIYFDNSVFDIYGMLISGAKLVMIPEKLLLFPSKLPAFLAEKEVTSVFWVPTVMINLANSGTLGEVPLPKLKTVCFAGEVMPNRTLNLWRRAYPDCLYANLYGPTEITDVCVYYLVDREFEDSSPLPIGVPCENMGCVILNERDEKCADGEAGELCIYGEGVALGYWNAPELTARAFTDDPTCPGRRIYRSGDLAYRAADGLIMYLGRRDGQVKVKGNRIELGEIETAAVCVPGVENAAAIFDAERQQIALFVQTKREFSLRKFNIELKKYIPAYMLPARLIVRETLPYNANGKIDRVKLRGELNDGRDT